MAIEGISHITFIVRNLESTARLFKEALGAMEVYSSEGKRFSSAREKFLLLGGVWIALMEGESLAKRTYNHVAFKVPAEELDKYEQRLRAAGVDVTRGRSRIEGEGESLYFYDYDNHLFELHAGTLERRLRAYNSGATTD